MFDKEDEKEELALESKVDEAVIEEQAADSGDDSEDSLSLDDQDSGTFEEAFVSATDDENSAEFLPEAEVDQDEELLTGVDGEELKDSELSAFESAAIEDLEFIEEERLESILESIFFATDRPVSLASLKLVFKGTTITTDKLKKAIDALAVEYAGGRRGITLEEVPGGYQLRTKIDNLNFLRRTLKARVFKLSGPALEVLSIVAYKQPVVKSEIDEIRGVESGHLLRALMEKSLVCFDGKSELPGRPMQYASTKKFLEIFGLRNLKELPTLSQIDELIPEGIGEDPLQKTTLSQITDSLSQQVTSNYSEGEDELLKIQDQLQEISVSTEFFEEEKRRQKEKQNQEKAQNIREALALGEPLSNRDIQWLKRYDEALAAQVDHAHSLDFEEKADSAAVVADVALDAEEVLEPEEARTTASGNEAEA
ncbi:MAG: SMC-Scp complex subunit ScpB [Pseudobdellovibrionaceae bacterium]